MGEWGGGNKRRWEKVDERGGGGGERGRKEEGEEMSQSERERESWNKDDPAPPFTQDATERRRRYRFVLTLSG